MASVHFGIGRGSILGVIFGFRGGARGARASNLIKMLKKTCVFGLEPLEHERFHHASPLEGLLARRSSEKHGFVALLPGPLQSLRNDFRSCYGLIRALKGKYY